MLDLYTENPTDLWVSLGKKFFGRHEETVDLDLGGRRFVSIGNILVVSSWPKEWTGGALFELVGYSENGHKMDVLRETYVDPARWKAFKEKAVQVRKKGYSVIGMQFNMSLERKGGCLSSCHLMQTRKRNTLFIHGKVAEIPRKFMADLLLVRDLLKELNIWPIRVEFLYSTVYFSIITLRSYATVLDPKLIKKVDIDLFRDRNFQPGTVKRLKQINKQYPNGSAIETLNMLRGEWETK